jgi:sigma-B regulation protein RsbU (phosphoserine phosphatase)
MMFFFILAMLFTSATADFLISRYAERALFEQLRSKLMSVAQLAAISVDAEALRAIPLSKGGEASPQYEAIAGKLLKIRDSVPSLEYIYILARTEKPNILKFIVDLPPIRDQEENTALPGEEYDASRFPEMFNGFKGPAADKQLGEDAWGVSLSGYAPIIDESGKSVAIIGVDMEARNVYLLQRQVHRRALFVFLIGLILSVALGFLISAGVSKQIRALTRGAQHLARGNLDYEVKVHGSDEISSLAKVFNTMSKDLKAHIEELKRTTAEKERLVREIEIAKEIQQSFLPEANPAIEGVQVAAVSIPARIVGGDFYDFIPINNDVWGLAIADVSGKGIPSALFMALSRALMRASAVVDKSPDRALNHANILIHQDSKACMFVTLFYAVIDAKKRTLKYTNAGHNPPLLMSKASSDIVLLKAQTMPLGVEADIKATSEEIALKKDDMIVLYTDGVTEAVNEKKEQYELERLEKIVKENRGLSADELMRKVESDLKKFVGKQPQFDDITIMIIKSTV